MNAVLAPGNEADRLQAQVAERCDGLFGRLREAGVLRETVDPVWARRVYYALMHEVVQNLDDDIDDIGTDELATQLVDTLLHGVGTLNPQL